MTEERSAIAAGRGRWNRDDPTPKFGWRRVRVVDRGAENLTTCEMCESASIRYEHHMQHPSGLRLVVGCICSGHMTLDAHYAEVDHDELVRALAEATEVDKRIRSIEGKLRTRTRSREKDATKLQRVMDSRNAAYLRIVIRHELPRFLKRAIKREAEVVAIEAAYPEKSGAAGEHIEHRQAVEAATVEASHLLRQAELRDFLADPDWYHTPKGLRAISPQGDVLFAYQDDRGVIKAMVKLDGSAEFWGNRHYPDFAAAQQQATKVMRVRLVKAGRLPRSVLD